MNCDPCLKFEYKIIRRPRRIGRNIFSVAAELNMIYNGEPYLYIEDLCIIDFICQLYRFSLEKSSCNVIPVDCQDKILIFQVQDDHVEIRSAWTDQVITVHTDVLLRAIQILKENFEREIGRKTDKFYS